ncbi:hypothetical protein GN958_ATG08449 [Phytophthora infestans]|uniref:Uncharacterized protein n=1 Tax=Phytophthora infestans TaxID=4787 RepID=A0A8S9UP49_PHYIN|nr:hypothetical protein GN958_ATG08449 [Phytophthora infestans]
MGRWRSSRIWFCAPQAVHWNIDPCVALRTTCVVPQLPHLYGISAWKQAALVPPLGFLGRTGPVAGVPPPRHATYHSSINH